MKILKTIGGFILGWLVASVVARSFMLGLGQTEITRTTDIIQVFTALCGGIVGAIITFKKVNFKKFED
jgi:mannose/fructose/N-acetylgalactosamine-specific phosphotransferase system component IID